MALIETDMVKIAELTDMASCDGDVTQRRWERSGKSKAFSMAALQSPCALTEPSTEPSSPLGSSLHDGLK